MQNVPYSQSVARTSGTPGVAGVGANFNVITQPQLVSALTSRPTRDGGTLQRTG